MMMGGGGMIMISGPPPPPPAPGGASPANARWNWRRMSLFDNVSLGRSATTPTGAFSHAGHGPHRGRLGAVERRRALAIQHRLEQQQLRNLNVNINVNARSAPPYTIRTGVDTNGDLVFTDRPDGVGRNTARAAAQWTMNGFFTYGWPFGKPVERPAASAPRRRRRGSSASQGAATERRSLPAVAQRQRPEPDEPRQPDRLHRHAHVEQLRAADDGPGTRKVDFGLGLSF